MTTGTDRIEAILQDAREIQASAVACLDQRDIRDAAEKAWRATKRATEALVLARTGKKPEGTPETGAAIRLLESMDEAVREGHLVDRYYTRWGQLHRECGHSGLCDPREDTERRVRDTAGYIEDAARLAGAEAHGVPATSSSGLILDPKAGPDEVRRDALLKVDQMFRRAWDEWHPGQSESAEVWGRYAQAILRLCEDVGAGDPIDPEREETRYWLDGYLIERYVRDEKEWEEVARDWDNAAQRQVPFLKRGLIRIFREDFIEWLGKKLDKRLGLHERGRRLRLVEAEPGRVNVHVEDCRTRRTRRTSRSVWKLPDTFQPPQRDVEEPGGDPEEELG